ncbi:MAG: RQC domain-containing protein, partial [Pseudoxanthomonas sp.]
CGNCDNCLQPAASWDATLAAQKALSCVYRTGQRFGVVHLIEVLRGGEGERIQQFGHDKLSTYGIGKDLDAKAWRGVFRQLVAAGLLEVDAEAFGGLRLTDASRAVLTGKQTVVLRKELPGKKQRERDRGPRTGVPVQAQDLPLFGALRDLRAQLAREQNVPAYVIFHDSTLRNIAEQRPGNLDELAQVGGIGGAKLERYGEQVLETIRAQA